jgi:NADPH:quinone reductase-like Zn-dependent oxidoreductase
VLQVRDVPDPAPNEREVLVRVRASGVQLADVMARQGLYPLAPKPPCVLGYEVAGEVERVGAAVRDVSVGARVLAMSHFGGHAERVSIPAGRVVPIPDAMTWEEAAALPVNYLTAQHLLFHAAAVQPGDRVLVHMAAGGVGLAALQLCRTVPELEVFGTASASKHAALRAHGCDHPIDYRTCDYAREVRRLTQGQGVDVVLDSLGGRDTRVGYKLLRSGGRLVMYGATRLIAGETLRWTHLLRASLPALLPAFAPLDLLKSHRTVAGVSLGRRWFDDDARTGRELSALLDLYTQGRVRPVVDSTFALEDAASAHRRLELRQNVGKVVLTV